MPHLLDSICTIIGVFYKYAQPHGGSFSLKRREMKHLIQKEFAEVIKNPHDPRTIELMFQMLDSNGDGLVDFSEYLLLIFKVAKACYSHLKPRENLLKKEQMSTAPRGRDQQMDERDHHQLRSDVRQERNIREREGSAQMYLRPTQAPGQRPERRDYHVHGPVTQVDQRNHQVHNLERRDPRGREREEEYVGQTQYRQQTEVKTHQQIRNIEPRKDDLGHRQIKERQPAIGEDTQYRSRNLLQGCNMDEHQNWGPNGKPLESYDSLPREQERRSQLPDPEWTQRRAQRHETELRERSRSSDPEWREEERTGQEQRAPLSREAEHREDQRDGPERERSGFPDQDTWGRPYTSPIRRAEVDDHQRSYASEHKEREERRLHPSELGPMNSKRRIPQPYESWTIEGEKRRPQHHQEEEGERRRPEPSESEFVLSEYRRPMIRGEEDNWRRERYYEPESQERENLRRCHEFKPRQGEAWEPVIREEVWRSQYHPSPEHPERDSVQRRSPACESTWRKAIQGRQQSYEPRSWEQENERTRRPQMHDLQPREGERRRPQMATLRQDEKERPQSVNLLNRTSHQDRSHLFEDSPRRINQSREQTYGFGLRDENWRTRQMNDPSYRDGEQHKQVYSVPEALEREHQMRARPHISECRGTEPSGLRRCYAETREREIKGHLYHRYAV